MVFNGKTVFLWKNGEKEKVEFQVAITILEL
jgi:hypothetical protein